MRLHPVAATVIAASAAGAALAWWVAAPSPVTLKSGTALERPCAIAPFRLVDQQGREFTRAALRGRWSLLFTGFTHGPDICPTTLALLRNFAVLAAYVAHFDPRLTGVTGARAEFEAFMSQLGLAQVRTPGVGGDYTVDHSTALVLINPQTRVAGHFMPLHDIGMLAADLASLDGRRR